MSQSIAILGASGLVGSALCAHILRSGLLEAGDRLQLVGHGERESTGRLLAIRADLLDAFDDLRVNIEVVSTMRNALADLVVVAAGVPMPPGFADRRDMGIANLSIFRQLAADCASYLPDATYLIVSNPVELAVQEFACVLDRKRVIGVGAEQDSLRFARSIARDLGLSRHDVHASVWGEHGRGMVPMWNSVHLRTSNPIVHQQLASLREKASQRPLLQRVDDLRTSVNRALSDGDIANAYFLVSCALPDARIFVEPFVTAQAIHSTPNATANAVLSLLRAWQMEDGRRVHAQVMMQGELKGLDAPFGIPTSISRNGWDLHADALTTSCSAPDLRDSLLGIRAFLSDCVHAANHASL